MGKSFDLPFFIAADEALLGKHSYCRLQSSKIWQVLFPLF